MKKGMIIGKRQLVLAVLILALGAAVYLNWRFADSGNELQLTGANSSKSTTSQNLGDAKYVNATSGKAFSDARRDREKARNDATAMLRETLKDVKADAAVQAMATEKLSRLAGNIQTENSIETLIKAKGFADCVAVINDQTVNIIVAVGSDGIMESEVLQIQDIVRGQIDVPLKNIHIVEVK